ncbi:hypothetical protein BHM03_00046610 [Ensete ventricosum]|nr:hypothetical protein BHM03_00046610 [Ensete ventricosum]
MRPTNFSEVTNFITQLAYCSLLRHRSRTPRLLVIDVATLRHGSRTPRLLGIEVATWIVIREEAEHANMWSRGGSTGDHLRCIEEDLDGSWGNEVVSHCRGLQRL